MENRYALRLLGAPQVSLDGQVLRGFESRKALALLCYLAARAQPVTRTHLADLFWGDKPESKGRGNLSRVLHNLNTLLPEVLTIDREQIGVAAPRLRSDTEEFKAFAESDRLEAWVAAASLYRDEFMAGLYLDDAPEFEVWLVAERERWHQAAVSVLERLAEQYAARREYDQALVFAARLLELVPWQEEAHRTRMRLLAQLGQTSAALTQYESCRDILQRELGLEPSAATRELYRQIKAGELAPAPARAPVPPHNLPAATTSFVGRAHELELIRQRLENSDCRLLTLVGPPGIGKTRLALQAAAQQLGAFPDGVYMIALAALNSPEFIVFAIADAMGLQFSGESEPKAQLLDYLRDKQMLLVLDNFEHVMAGADTVLEILRYAPGQRLVVTSRERLNFQAECVLHVRGLDIPTGSTLDGDVVKGYGAVQLLMERARRVDARSNPVGDELAAIIRICQLLDGVPLALELAAAGVSRFTMRTIAEQLEQNLDSLKTNLRDVVPRHQSLRAVLDWSYALLAPREQRLLNWLSVFRGDWSLEAAEAVCAAQSTGMRVFESLDQLAEKSLVMAEQHEGELYYRLLHIMRDYASRHLDRAGETELARARHLDYYVWLAEQAEGELTTAHQGMWLMRLENEKDNLRAALEWGLADPSGYLLGLRLASALWRFWYMRGYIVEGKGWLNLALERNPDAPAALRARAVTGAGYMAWCMADYERAWAWHEQALDLYRAEQDPRGTAYALHNLGAVAVYRHELAHGAEFFQASVELARETGDPWLLSVALIALGESARYQGDLTRARQLQEQGLENARASGDKQITALALNNLGLVAVAQGAYADATEFFGASLMLYQQTGERRLIAEELEGLAGVFVAQGKIAVAARVLAAAQALRETIHHPLPAIDVPEHEKKLARLRAALTQAELARLTAEGSALSWEEAILYALENSRGTSPAG